MAGNMWEWTTEERGYKDVANSSTGTFAVRRGGSFADSAGDYPVSSRGGNCDASWSYISIGFRVVLYINE